MAADPYAFTRAGTSFPGSQGGLYDMINWYEFDVDMLSDIMGYTIQDISGDGVPELMVALMPEYSPWLTALYTLVDGEPQLVIGDPDGSNYSDGGSYAYMGYGEFFFVEYTEDGGYQGTYTISLDGTALECTGFTFYRFDDMIVYENTTGSRDRAESQATGMDPGDFNAYEGFEPVYETSLTPLATSGDASGGGAAVESEAPVSVRSLTEEETWDLDCEWVTLYEGFYPSYILITSDSWADNLRLWSLSVEDMAEDGAVTFASVPAGDGCHWDQITVDTPIAVQLTFPGDLPAWGISYEDQHGILRRVAIGQSSYDGSIYLEEIDPDEAAFVLRPAR